MSVAEWYHVWKNLGSTIFKYEYFFYFFECEFANMLYYDR